MKNPVTKWENEKVNGAALCNDRVLAMESRRVDALRNQQADYRASLPADPTGALKAALDAMYPEGDSYPEGFEEAMHLSCALRPMVERLGTDEPGAGRDALLYIIDRIEFGLRSAADSLDHIGDILDNPRKDESEARDLQA